MFQKSKGGRGKKADIPYARGSFTLPPELKQYLDAQAEKYGVSMSEMLARILQEHQEMTARPQTPQPAEIPEGESTTPPVRGTSMVPTAPKKRGVRRTSTERLALHVPALGVIQKRIPRGLGWKPERYERAERMLSEGDVMYASGINYRSEAGTVMDYRTAEALVRLGVLVPA